MGHWDKFHWGLHRVSMQWKRRNHSFVCEFLKNLIPELCNQRAKHVNIHNPTRDFSSLEVFMGNREGLENVIEIIGWKMMMMMMTLWHFCKEMPRKIFTSWQSETGPLTYLGIGFAIRITCACSLEPVLNSNSYICEHVLVFKYVAKAISNHTSSRVRTYSKCKKMYC